MATSASGAGGSGEEAGSGPGSGNFECNICLDTAKDAVVSMCGHLFCWPCLHRWMETQQTRVLCPVCKASINRDKVIPLYGRGSSNDKDPRDKVPPRPQGQRQEAEQAQGFFGSNLFGDGGMNMSFGIGAFPFGFMATTFNIGGAAHQNSNNEVGTEEEQFMSKLFMWIAVLFIIWLLIA